MDKYINDILVIVINFIITYFAINCIERFNKNNIAIIICCIFALLIGGVVIAFFEARSELFLIYIGTVIHLIVEVKNKKS